jgi:A/G-specific adenine glycosylase
VTPPSARDLLDWYDRNGRTLPWRGDAAVADPYRVWLSEVMLQQTTVAAVAPRFARFLARFPNVEALAAAAWEEVAEEWAGLGYYARARNLHAGARMLAARGFPTSVEGLREIPGIGPYTAAAIGAIAFGLPVVPLDGNIERIAARIHAVETPLPQAKAALAAHTAAWMTQPEARARPGDFAQALFDLGARICTPREPACVLCPWREGCRARQGGRPAELPRKAPRAVRPQRHGTHFCAIRSPDEVLVRRRPESGLLGGMLELPGTPWRDTPWPAAEALPLAPPLGLTWRALPGAARHGFTHFELEMQLFVATAPEDATAPAGHAWMGRRQAQAAMPTVMRKLLALQDGAKA